MIKTQLKLLRKIFKMKPKRTTYYDPKEEKLNVLSHGIGLVLSIIALVLLVIYASLEGNSWHIISFSIYGASLDQFRYLYMYTYTTP